MSTADGADDGRTREVAVIAFGPNDLGSLRLRVARETAPYLPATQVGEMVLAVYEVALNSIEHAPAREPCGSPTPAPSPRSHCPLNNEAYLHSPALSPSFSDQSQVTIT